jgi:broad specificity phosphatase PhoE
MTVCILIRHGHTDAIGKIISGRMPGVHLNRRGKEEVERIAEYLTSFPIDALFSSPLERTLETSRILSEKIGIPVRVAEDLNEIEFGTWTGQSFEELGKSLEWRLYNTYRSGNSAGGGEFMLDVQKRVVRFLLDLSSGDFPHGTVLAVSHGDVIRSAVAYFAGIPLDLSLRLRIDPASVSILALHERGAEIRCVNESGCVLQGFPYGSM